jgi:hypothetical protein
MLLFLHHIRAAFIAQSFPIVLDLFKIPFKQRLLLGQLALLQDFSSKTSTITEPF